LRSGAVRGDRTHAKLERQRLKPVVALQRIQKLNATDQNLVLRLRVDAGGCSGFSYKFDLDSDPASDDM